MFDHALGKFNSSFVAVIGQKFIDFVDVQDAGDVSVYKSRQLFGKFRILFQEHFPDADRFNWLLIFRVHTDLSFMDAENIK